MTYIFISIPFLAIAMVLFVLKLQSGTPKLLPITAVSALTLCSLTIIFDNLMVWLISLDMAIPSTLAFGSV